MNVSFLLCIRERELFVHAAYIVPSDTSFMFLVRFLPSVSSSWGTDMHTSTVPHHSCFNGCKQHAEEDWK